MSAEEPLFSCSLWGPSADDLDQVVERCLLPELSVGDWLLFSNAGANSLGPAFTNRDEHKPLVFYSISEYDWYGVNVCVLVSKLVHLCCFFNQIVFLRRQEIRNCGVSLDTGMKNFFLGPCCLRSCMSEAAISTPA